MKYMKKKVDLLVMGFKRSQVQYLAILELTDLLRILCINTVPQQLYYLRARRLKPWHIWWTNWIIMTTRWSTPIFKY